MPQCQCHFKTLATITILLPVCWALPCLSPAKAEPQPVAIVGAQIADGTAATLPKATLRIAGYGSLTVRNFKHEKDHR